MTRNKRWIFAAEGVLLLLIAGIVYAWSVLSAPVALAFPQWTKAELSMTFTIVMILFCLGCLAGGLLSSRLKPRVFCMVSAVLSFAGYWISSRAAGLAGLYTGFGVLCGFASGFVYSACMSTVSKWFPDCPGLISGILLMGFGISSFAAGKIYQATLVSWRTSFFVLGIISCAVLFLCGLFFRAPDASFEAPKPAEGKKRAVRADAPDSEPKQTLKDPSFWFFYVWAILLSAAGLMIVSQANGMVREVSPELAAGTAATVIGLISVFNGVGRIFYGSLFDRAGRAITMQLDNVNFVLAALLLIFAVTKGSLALLVPGFILSGFAYGGVPPTNSAFASSAFGRKHYPVNLSLINTNLIIASFGSTAAGRLYDVTHSFLSVFFAIIALAVLGAVLSRLISRRERR